METESTHGKNGGLRDIKDLVASIGEILKENSRYARIVEALSLIIFVMGVILFVKGLNADHWQTYTIGGGLTGFLYWPIQQMLMLWRCSVLLTTAPILTKGLESEHAARFLSDMLKKFGF